MFRNKMKIVLPHRFRIEITCKKLNKYIIDNSRETVN